MTTNSTALTELKDTRELCALLLQTPHYAKIGPEGIFAIVETAKSLGIDPRLALGGGLYYVKGKVEMSARMMAALIRSRKHSITRDTKSTDEICILHGKRADTGDCWTESFSIDEAKRAGLVRAGSPWVTFPRDMLYARALSRLARQLFPDTIGNTYVEGELSLDANIQPTAVIPSVLSEDQIKRLNDLFASLDDVRQKRFIDWAEVPPTKLPADRYDAAFRVLTALKSEGTHD